jgi:hypothetical protein
MSHMNGKFGSLFGADGEETNVLDPTADFGVVNTFTFKKPGAAPPPPPVEAAPVVAKAPKKTGFFHNLLAALHLVKK